jgi:hypothetical protein
MSTSKEITDLISHKVSSGETDIEFNQVVSELYGESGQYIQDFRKNFDGKYSHDVKDLLMKAGIESLMTEQSLAFYEINEIRDNFSSLVHDMLFGDGEVKKASLEKRAEIAERQFCINMAIEELKLIRRDMEEFLKPYRTNKNQITEAEHKRLSSKKIWWMD